MLTYDALRSRPAAFRTLTGMGPDDFDALLDDFLAAQARRREAATRTRKGTARVAGPAAAAASPTWTTATASCWRLAWLRIYPTYELLGLLFGLHKRNAQLNAATS